MCVLCGIRVRQCLTRALGADGGLCANGGVFVNGVCLPPTQEYVYGGVGAVVRMRCVVTPRHSC